MKRRRHSGRGLGGELPAYGCELGYHPESYWHAPASINANIKGTRRRKLIAAGYLDLANGPPPSALFADSVDDGLLEAMGRIHPSLMGGEDLPEYERREVEIARIELASVLGDVISIRARKSRDGDIRYRVVGEDPECGSYILKRRRRSKTLLTLSELIELIETTETFDGDEILRLCYDEPGGGFEAHGIVQTTWEEQYVGGSSIEEALAFLTISSPFYPQLSEWFAGAGRRWAREKAAEQERDEEEVESKRKLMEPVFEHARSATWTRATGKWANWGNAILFKKIVGYAEDYLAVHGCIPEGEHLVGAVPVVFPSIR